jgi:hypothetical protein
MFSCFVKYSSVVKWADSGQKLFSYNDIFSKLFQIFQVLEHPVERDKLATLQDLVSSLLFAINIF